MGVIHTLPVSVCAQETNTFHAASPFLLSNHVHLGALLLSVAVCARMHAGPSVPGPAAAARARMAYIILRLLTVISECQLHARLPGARAGAKEAATDA